MARPRVYSEELRRRTIAEVRERGRSVREVASQLGIKSPETLRRWIEQYERDEGPRPGAPSTESAELKALRKEVADQQRTIEILKAATSFFAREADRRPK